MEDKFNITNTKGKYSLHGNQSSFLEKLTKVFKNKKVKEDINLIKEVIRKNKPNYSDEQILELAKEISSSGCTYVAAARDIMEQINYDEEEFYQMFKFPLRNSFGELNHDALIAELYSFMKDKAKFDLPGFYQTVHYNSNIEAAKNILGRGYTSESEAFTAIFNAGYTINGTAYTKFIANPEIIIEDYHFIAHKLLGADVVVNSIEELKSKLKEKGITIRVDDYINSYKFSGLNVKSFDLWMNYYFKSKNIDLEFSSVALYCNSYQDLVEKLREYIDAGASITVGSEQNLSMTDGSKLGWFNYASIGSVGGHAMPFLGISSEGDFILTSWGEKQMVPKEFYDRMKFSARKLNKREIVKKVEADIKEMAFNNNIYDSINKKINYIIDKIQIVDPSQIEAIIMHNYKFMFTKEEQAIISLDELNKQIMDSYLIDAENVIKR